MAFPLIGSLVRTERGMVSIELSTAMNVEVMVDSSY
jgi:hypothetical protein